MVFFFAGSLSLWFVGLLLSCLPSSQSSDRGTRYHFRFKMRWGSDPLHVAWMDVTNEVPCRNVGCKVKQHQAGFAIQHFFFWKGGGRFTSPFCFLCDPQRRRKCRSSTAKWSQRRTGFRAGFDGAAGKRSVSKGPFYHQPIQNNHCAIYFLHVFRLCN